jgi:hypothetical protein
MARVKLSELSDGTEISYEGCNHTYDVATIKHEITVIGEAHHEHENWFVCESNQWKPSAENMIETYIENEAGDLHDGAHENLNVITEEQTARIQAILDEAYGEGFHYWSFGDDVDIDIFPAGYVTKEAGK